jgi:hypothetical protein
MSCVWLYIVYIYNSLTEVYPQWKDPPPTQYPDNEGNRIQWNGHMLLPDYME